jgi:alkanesulfonate monooxygenase SsuD/methylene tetrahydromethanopterin reductase-like flavin-dependent oxidoreductase (luciferase family)
MGEGSNTTELHPFDVRFREKREVFEDAVRALMPAFWNTSWAYTGTHFNLPERNLIPKPIQKPHPPLWVACSQAETIRMAGRWGMGALGFAFVDPDAARAWVHAYYNAFLNAPLPLESYVRNPNLACSYYFSCGPTDEIAIERADGATFFEFSLGKYQKDGPFAAGQTSFWTDYEEWRATDKAKQKQANLARTMVIGSPATLRERIKEIRDTHIDQIVLIAQTGRTPHQDIMDSIELFGTEVMPEFQGDSEHEAWKQKVLDRENVLDDIDTTGQNTLLAVDQAVRPETKAFAQNL